MIKSQPQSSWNLPSSYTRVATSVSFAVALMVAFYYVVSYGPNLVDAHSLLLSFFENDKAARTGIANFAVFFSLAMQVLMALVCAYVSSSLTGKEKLPHAGLLLFGLFYGFVMFGAAMLMGLANYSKAEVAALGSPNEALFFQLCFFAVIFAIAYGVPFGASESRHKENPMFFLAMGKILVLLCFAFFVPTKVTLTLLVGSYILDFLLHPVGEKIKDTTCA